MTTKRMSLGAMLEKLNGPLTFARFVIAERMREGLTQAELARRIGLSRAKLCDIEKGRQFVSVALAAKIAKKAGWSPEVAIETCLQDQVSRARLGPWRVRVARGDRSAHAGAL